jgi:hypothetical protein
VLRSPRSRFRANVTSECFADSVSDSDRLRDGLFSEAICEPITSIWSVTRQPDAGIAGHELGAAPCATTAALDQTSFMLRLITWVCGTGH